MAVKIRQLAAIFILNIVGAALLLSWYLPGGEPRHGFWFALDKQIFYFFNNLLTQSQPYMYLVAITNLRAFDLVSFFCMLGIFYAFYRKEDAIGKRRLFCMGVAMLLSAVLVKQFGNLLDYTRRSPTRFFEGVNLVSVLSGIPAKDGSVECFPSDHTMMLLIFASFMLRYFGRGVLPRCAAVVIIFSLPRILGGAHWFTDSAVGALGYVCIAMSWLLLTPAADTFIAWLAAKVPLKYFTH